MRPLSVMFACALAACAPAAREPDDLGVAQQAFSVNPDFTGTTGDDWGASLAACRGGGYVAGAPASRRAWLSGAATPTAPGPSEADGLGSVVACLFFSGSSRVLAGSDAGLYFSADDGGWTRLSSNSVVALARPRSFTLPILVGGGGRVHRLSPTSLFLDQTPILLGTSSFGAALAWDERNLGAGARVAVSAPQSSQVFIYAWPPGNPAVPTNTIASQGPLVPIVFGDVHPEFGVELIARTANGTVTIFSNAGTELMVLKAPSYLSATFGVSLAINPASKVAPLEELWIGDPGAKKVYRFIGDAGAPHLGPASSGLRAFGARMVFSETTPADLSVGDPEYTIGAAVTGAVFTEPVLSPSPLEGEPRECEVGAPCVTSNCGSGECVGGVYCAATPGVCPPGYSCDRDAGECRRALPDAGDGIDAGNPGPLDAGKPDPLDAGKPDPSDAGNPGPLDAGKPDPSDAGDGVIDAGNPGPVDAGEDAGLNEPKHDGGVRDGGEADAGAGDAGAPDGGAPVRDGGVEPGKADAGTGADGGLTSDELVVFKTCGCAGGPALPLLLLGLALLRRRGAR